MRLTALSSRGTNATRMKRAAESDLLHLLFPHVRAEILRMLFLNPSKEIYGRQTARDTTLALRTVQRELALLEAAGFLTSQKEGRRRLFRANRKHRMFPALQHLVSNGASGRPFVNRAKSPRQGWRRSGQKQRQHQIVGSPLPKPRTALF
jgi:DNA-binding transcriptional ArsR family regulator